LHFSEAAIDPLASATVACTCTQRTIEDCAKNDWNHLMCLPSDAIKTSFLKRWFSYQDVGEAFVLADDYYCCFHSLIKHL